MRNGLLTTEPKSIETYRGLTIHADTGLHDQMMALVREHLPGSSSVIDVGAGAGAFSARLIEAGFSVTPVDIDPDKWALPEIELRVADINQGVPDDLIGVFDAACALEVIEHVENPWQFMRDIASLVKPRGYLFLSTPNVSSFWSRLVFLRRGRFPQFDVPAIEYGHINPMTPFALELVASRTDWEIVTMRPGGYLPVFDLSIRDAKLIPRNIARGLAYIVAGGPKRGWCTLCVFRKTQGA